MTLAEIKRQVLQHWIENYPEVAEDQPAEWLDRQATAQARMTMAEITTMPSPLISPEEAWSEVSSQLLIPCPVMDETETQAP